MTLNRMYHCVPRIISGDSQMSGLSRKRDDRRPPRAGNSTLAGKAARNCATGCTRSAQRGRSPIQTPIGTQIRLARAISTSTRSSVSRPEPNGRSDVAPARASRAHEVDDQPQRRPGDGAATSAIHSRSTASRPRAAERDGRRWRARHRGAPRQGGGDQAAAGDAQQRACGEDRS